MLIPALERFPRLEVGGNLLQTTLSVAISSSTRPVTITPASMTGWPTTPGFRILIDAELLLITYVGATTWIAETVENTTPTTHSIGATVTQLVTWGGIQQLFTDHSGERGQAHDPHAMYVRRDDNKVGGTGLRDVDAGFINVQDFGALGEVGVDHTSSVAAAIAAAPNGSIVLFPQRTSSGAMASYNISSIYLPNKTLTFWMYGATINCTAKSTFAFIQSNRKRLTLKGGTFSGIGSGVAMQLGVSGVQSYDFSAEDVNFVLSADETGMFLGGVRECTVSNCWFDGCLGVWITESVNTHFVGCQFRDCSKGIYGQGTPTGTAFNAGLMMNNCTMLGCGYGVHVLAWDWVSIINCMLDYNDRPVILTNVDTAALIGSYFSNRTYAGTASPTIQVGTDTIEAGGFSQHINIIGNQIICHADDLPDLNIALKIGGVDGGVDWMSISDNDFHFHKRYGIQVTEISNYLMITGNRFNHNQIAPPPTNPASIIGTGGNDGTWIIRDNQLDLPMQNVSFAIVRDNIPPTAPTLTAVAGAGNAGTSPPAPADISSNDWRGVFTFGTGSGTTGTGAYVSVAFDRDYGTIPSVTIAPGNQATAVKQPYVTNIQATGFDIGLGVAGAASQSNTTYNVSYQVVV
jgi:hypothetical protein